MPGLYDDQTWQAKLKEVKQFKRENNHIRIPHRYTSGSGAKLGQWVNKQREFYAKGILCQDRLDDLNAIGFSWNPHGDAWQEKFELLKKQYKEEHGDCLVPGRHGLLGKWVSHQREFYKNNKLSDERIVKLNSIGFCWNLIDDLWQEKFELLQQYKEDHGNCLVPCKQEVLGQWVALQRQDYKNNKLSDDRIAKLNSIEFVWDPFDEDWQEKFSLLKQYKEQHGNCLVPQRLNGLGMWVADQRRFYKNNKLSDERMAKLNSIGFVWDATGVIIDNQNAAWKEKFELLKQYKEEHGNCLVPARHGTLGKWVSWQRQQHKNIKLSNDRIVQLNSIGFVWELRKISPVVSSSRSTHVANACPASNRNKGRHRPETSSPSPKRHKAERLSALHDEQRDAIAGNKKVIYDENETVNTELEEEEQEEENLNNGGDHLNISPIVDELSKAQLERIVSILQISNPGAVAYGMALINP